MLAGACQPEPGSRVIKYFEDDVESWRTKEINLLDSDAPGAQGTRIFSAKMPIVLSLLLRLWHPFPELTTLPERMTRLAQNAKYMFRKPVETAWVPPS